MLKKGKKLRIRVLVTSRAQWSRKPRNEIFEFFRKMNPSPFDSLSLANSDRSIGDLIAPQSTELGLLSHFLEIGSPHFFQIDGRTSCKHSPSGPAVIAGKSAERSQSLRHSEILRMLVAFESVKFPSFEDSFVN